MAFPTIPTAAASTLLQSSQSTATTTHTFPNLSSLPNTPGALLLAVIVKYDGNSTNAEFSSWGGGFTEFVDQAAVVTNGPGAIGAAYKLNATGSESGTFTVTSAGSGRSVMFLMEITGAHTTTPPEATARATGTTAAADPAALNPAGWDAEDTLWIAVANNDETSLTGSFTGITAAPTNYTDYLDSGIIGGDVIGALEGAVAFRQLNAASEDAGAFTVDTSAAANSALLIAVRPAPVLGPVHESHTLVTGFTSDTSIAFTEPSGFTSTDVAVACIYLNAPKTVTPPSGAWTLKSNLTSLDGPENQVWWKRGDAGGSYTFTWTGATGKVGSCHRISGAATSGDPFDAFDHEKTDTASTTSPTVAVTTTVADTLLFHYRQAFAGSAVWTPATGFTEVYESADITVGVLSQAAIGSSGSVVGSYANSSRQIAFLGALKPPGGDATATPAVIARTVDVVRPNVNVVVFPAVVSATATLPASPPNVVAGPAVIPATAALPASNQNIVASPAVVPAVAALPQAAGGVHATPTPAVLASVAALAQPNVHVVAGPAVLAGVAALPAVTPLVGAGPAVIPLIVAVPQVTAGQTGGGDATATPAVLAAVAALAQPAVNVTVPPAVVATAVNIGTGLGGNTTAGPAVIQVVVGIPQATPQAGGSATAAPAVIAALAVLGQATPSAASTVSPGVLSTAATIPGVGASVAASPALLAALTGLQRPLADVAAGPAVLPLVAAVPTPTISAGGNVTITPATIAALAALAQPNLNVRAGPAIVALLAALAQAQAGQAAIRTPATAAAAVSLPAAGASVAAGPAVIALLVAVPLVADAGGEPVPGYGVLIVGVPAGGLRILPAGGQLYATIPNGKVSL